MYIPEFWCGVIVCIAVEFCAIIGYSIYINMKGNKYGKNNDDTSNKPSKR